MPQRAPISPQWRMNFCWTGLSGLIFRLFLSLLKLHNKPESVKGFFYVLRADDFHNFRRKPARFKAAVTQRMTTPHPAERAMAVPRLPPASASYVLSR